MKFTTLFALVGAASAEGPSMLHQVASMVHANNDLKSQTFLSNLAGLAVQNGVVEETPMSFVHHLADLAIAQAEKPMAHELLAMIASQ